jgi:hypothetical protein
MTTPTHAGRGTSRPARLALALLLGVGVAAGIAVALTAPAMADPSPMPGPGQTTSPGIPDTGTRPSPSGSVVLPGQNPTTNPNPNPTPSPIGPPPTGNPNPNPTTTPTPNPTPGTNPSRPPATTTEDDPAWYDIPGQIRKAINDFFAWMIEASLTPIMNTLGTTVLSTPDLTNNPQVKAIWTTCLVIANAVFVLFVVIGGFVVTSRETLQTRHGFKEILPRLIIGGVGANMSLVLIREILQAVNGLTAAIAGQGVDGHAAASAVTQALTGAIMGHGFLLTLMILAVLVMAIVVLLTFILRVACLILLIGVAPLALICHSTPQTEGLAYTWWRAFGACLGMQLAQAVIMLATIRVFLTPSSGAVLGLPVGTDGFLGILVCLTMLWVQIKLPGWMKMFILGPLGQSKGRGLLGQLITTILTIKTLGAAAGVLGGAKAAGSVAGTAARRGAVPSRPRPGPGGLPRPGPSRPPRPPRPRPSPPPAGPAAFSHAPASHTPLGRTAGTASASTFSHAGPSAVPGPASTGAAPPAVFSAAPGTEPAPSAAPPPSTAPFSHPPTASTAAEGSTTGTAPASTSAPAVVLSSAPRAQTAPQRPPAPVTPTFSSAPATSPRQRPTAAKRAPATPARTPRPTGATPATPPRASRTAVPAPRPSPAARPSPTVRAAVPSPTNRPAPAPGRPR